MSARLAARIALIHAACELAEKRRLTVTKEERLLVSQVRSCAECVDVQLYMQGKPYHSIPEERMRQRIEDLRDAVRMYADFLDEHAPRR